MPTKIAGFGAKIWKLVKRDEFLPEAAKMEVLSLSQQRTVSAQFIFLQINDTFLVRKKPNLLQGWMLFLIQSNFEKKGPPEI